MDLMDKSMACERHGQARRLSLGRRRLFAVAGKKLVVVPSLGAGADNDASVAKGCAKVGIVENESRHLRPEPSSVEGFETGVDVRSVVVAAHKRQAYGVAGLDNEAAGGFERFDIQAMGQIDMNLDVE